MGLFPIGFEFSKPVKNISYEMISVRDFDPTKKENQIDEKGMCLVVQIFLPLIAIIIPYWLSLYYEIGVTSKNRLVQKDFNHGVLLLSGCGDSRNVKFSPEDNSTITLSQRIIKHFINSFYSCVKIVHHDSGPGIFHYSDNVRFVSNYIRPGLEQNRDKMAKKCREEWSRYFHVTLSLTDGTPARVGSITEGLRMFKPDLLHVWSLKTLWNRKTLGRRCRVS